jgi:hypothetical protein
LGIIATAREWLIVVGSGGLMKPSRCRAAASSSSSRTPADHCRAIAAECRQLALAAESEIEKTLLTNLVFSWNRLANQTDRYVEYLKTRTSET